MHQIRIALKDDSHIKYISLLINMVIKLFIKRYCVEDKDYKIRLYGYSDLEDEIIILDYVYDIFNHVFKLERFKEISYLDIESQYELYKTIVKIILEELNLDIKDDDDK